MYPYHFHFFTLQLVEFTDAAAYGPSIVLFLMCYMFIYESIKIFANLSWSANTMDLIKKAHHLCILIARGEQYQPKAADNFLLVFYREHPDLQNLGVVPPSHQGKPEEDLESERNSAEDRKLPYPLSERYFL